MKIYAYKGKDNLCGERIRLARAKNRITQSDLAARMQVAGVTIERDSISRIERDTVTIVMVFFFIKNTPNE